MCKHWVTIQQKIDSAPSLSLNKLLFNVNCFYSSFFTVIIHAKFRYILWNNQSFGISTFFSRNLTPFFKVSDVVAQYAEVLALLPTFKFFNCLNKIINYINYKDKGDPNRLYTAHKSKLLPSNLFFASTRKQNVVIFSLLHWNYTYNK